MSVVHLAAQYRSPNTLLFFMPQPRPPSDVAKRCLAIVAMIGGLSLPLGMGVQVSAADLDTANLLYRSGDYAAASEIAQAEVDRGVWNERWSRLLIRCQLATGRYADAKATYEKAIQRYSGSLVLRRLGMEAYRFTGDEEGLLRAKGEFVGVMQRSARYASRDNVLAAGQYFADQGEDAREVLKQFYDRVRDAAPDYLETYIATAELALSKGDYAVAADTLAKAIEIDSTDPRVFYLQAKAFAPSDRKLSNEAVQMALTVNPVHADSWLLLAENSIDAEQYEKAKQAVSKVLTVNPHEPRAWAMLAVMAHVDGDYAIEKLMRAAALSTWPKNPAVDHLIGRKLSDKYRFQEGSEYQQRALSFAPKHAAANFQLSQDLLRLGFDDVGWALAKKVQSDDPYNVVAFNLVSLYDRLQGFSDLQRDGILVRMEPKEARIYGEAVLDLLTEAREVLCEKYDIEPDGPVIVEIFPNQDDFAIRTFGLPGGDGFLGVCFGRLITANSPASQGKNPTNWKSVLWHEFCHVVTLTKTKNRMPRWLSEGISVYEERQRNRAWSEKMSPTYKQMILGGELSPISDMSAAFLNPKSGMHLQFAYYQSSLAVEFLIDEFGPDALKNVLDSLGEGVGINDAISMHCAPIERLDDGFLAAAIQKADDYAKDIDWDPDGPPIESGDDEAIEAWFQVHPDDYRSLDQQADRLLAAGDDEAAIKVLERLRDAGATHGGRGGTLSLLADSYRRLNNTDKERQILKELISTSGSAMAAHQRLAKFAADEADWETVDRHANEILAIHPLIESGHVWKVKAAQADNRPADAIGSLKTLLELSPIDPAGLHYQLASAQESIGQMTASKQSVLRALETAPRYRDALSLLLRVNQQLAQDETIHSDSEEEFEASDETTIAVETQP